MNKNYLIKYLKKSVLTGLSKSVIVAAITLLLIPLIIKQIGMEYYGIIMLTLLFSGVTTIVDLGISKSVTLLIGKSEDQKNKNTIVSGALYLNLLLALMVGIIVFTLIFYEVQVFGSDFEAEKFTKTILIVGFLILVISLLKGLASSVLEAFYLMHYINIGHAVSSLLLYGTIYLFSLLTAKLSVLLLTPLIPLCIVLFYYIIIIRWKTNLCITKVSFKSIKKLSQTAFKFLNLGLLNSIILPGNKYLLIFISGNTSLLGIFDIGLKIATAANNLMSSLSGPLFGVFSNIGKTNRNRVYKIAMNSMAILLAAYFIGIIFFYFLGDSIANIIDEGNKNLIATSGLILLIGICFSGVSEPIYRALIGTERLKEAFYLKLIVPIVNLIAFASLVYLDPLNRVNVALSLGIFSGSFAMIIYYYIKN